MAQVLFMGSEPADFVPYGRTGFDTTTSSPYRRGTLTVTGGSDTFDSDHLSAGLEEPATEVYATIRVTADTSGAMASRPFLLFRNGSSPVAGLGINGGKLALIGFSGATASTLATSPQAASYVADAKIDLRLDLTTGKVMLWTNGVLMLETTVSPASFGAPSTDSLSLLSTGTGTTRFAEIVVARFDLRAARVATLSPNANDPARSGWSGSYTDVADANWQAADT
ncbi:MAG TPA: hypothetical protein VFE52_06230, partial [Devosia sp.]|nr:hypothetical protein [Devosia sp.]